MLFYAGDISLPGVAQDGHFVSIFTPPGPDLRGLSLWADRKFPARKICVAI